MTMSRACGCYIVIVWQVTLPCEYLCCCTVVPTSKIHRFICDYLQEPSVATLRLCHIAQTRPHSRLSHPEVSTRLRLPTSALHLFLSPPSALKAKSLTLVFHPYSSAQVLPTTRLVIQDLDLSRQPAMREANFAFPAQNRACVCISSQLYDRRGWFSLFRLESFTHFWFWW